MDNLEDFTLNEVSQSLKKKTLHNSIHIRYKNFATVYAYLAAHHLRAITVILCTHTLEIQ